MPLIVSSTLYLRLVATICIVWFHTPRAPLRTFAGVGLVLFLYLTFMHSAHQKSLWPAFIRRTKRLLIVWAGWWVFYAAIKIWMHRDASGELFPAWSLSTALTWPAVHLWYLPFIYVNSFIPQIASIAMTGLQNRRKIALSLLIGVALFSLVPYGDGLPAGVRHWWKALPSIGIGMAFGYCMRLKHGPKLVAFTTVAAVVCIGCFFLLRGTPEGRDYSWAAILMILCAMNVPRSRSITKLTCLTLGIFLIHPFMLLVLIKLLGATCPFWILMPTTFLFSGVATWILRSMPYARAFV